MTIQFDTYTFSECITLANKCMATALNGRTDTERNLAAGYASKWFIRAEAARETGTAHGESWFRQNYLTPELCECGCEVAPDGSHATACRCCECCGEYPCKYPTMDDDGDDCVIDTRWYGLVKK